MGPGFGLKLEVEWTCFICRHLPGGFPGAGMQWATWELWCERPGIAMGESGLWRSNLSTTVQGPGSGTMVR